MSCTDFMEEAKEQDFQDAMDALSFAGQAMDNMEQVLHLRKLIGSATEVHEEMAGKHRATLAKLLERGQAEFDAHRTKVQGLEEQLDKRLAMLEAEKETCTDLKVENAKLHDKLISSPILE